MLLRQLHRCSVGGAQADDDDGVVLGLGKERHGVADAVRGSDDDVLLGVIEGVAIDAVSLQGPGQFLAELVDGERLFGFELLRTSALQKPLDHIST